jgi:hypothetical protein
MAVKKILHDLLIKFKRFKLQQKILGDTAIFNFLKLLCHSSSGAPQTNHAADTINHQIIILSE